MKYIKWKTNYTALDIEITFCKNVKILIKISRISQIIRMKVSYDICMIEY